MSSLRNSLHRRNHKERSQLAHRAKFGILEKHKDYVLRARDYHSKQERIKTLRRKAADRNKDEFYFGMVHQRTNQGVHIQDRGNVAMPVDMVKILKTQDENYVRTMRNSNAKKIDRIKSQLSAMADLVHGGGEVGEEERAVLEKSGVLPSRKLKGKAKARSANGPKHVVFVEEDEEDTYLEPSSPAPAQEATSNDDTEIDLGWKPEGHQKRKKGKQRPQGQDNPDLQLLEEESEKHRRRLVQELSARMERDKQLRYAERELEMQRLLMGKGRTKKLRGVELVRDEGDDDGDDDGEDGNRPARSSEKTYKPRVYKWKAERKR